VRFVIEFRLSRRILPVAFSVAVAFATELPKVRIPAP
jgi:hypothetical protein